MCYTAVDGIADVSEDSYDSVSVIAVSGTHAFFTY
jgi:hypothetical protein